MATPSSEPEKYSLDEMMARLKGKPAEDPASGELVTRADGSQAIRIRKRKRRSDQPKREEAKRLRRLRAIQIGTALSGLIVLTLIIGGLFIYTNTAPFRNKLSTAISATLGAEVEFKMFRVTPVSANADGVALNWQDAGFLKQARLRGVSARISPRTVFGQSLNGEEIIAREGEIQLQASTSERGRSHPAADTMPVSFDRAVVTKLDCTFGDPAAAAFKITGTEASLNVVPNKSWKTLNLHRGSLAIQGWPALKLDRALINVRSTEVELVTVRITDSLATRGQMTLSGAINTQSPADLSTLNVKLAAFNLADLFGAEAGKLLNLRLDSREIANSNYLAFAANAPADAELAVSFANALAANNSLTGLHFLSFLAGIIGDDYYEKPEFDDITGIARRKGGQLDFTELLLERKTHLSIRGNLSVGPDQSLSGTLQVGLPESVIHLVSNPEKGQNPKLDAVFGPVVNNFRWATVKLSGSLTTPADDFAQSYAAAPAAAPAPAVPEAPDGSANPEPATPGSDPAQPIDPGKAFEDFTTPP